MTISSLSTCSLFAFLLEVIQKPMFFKSFTSLTVPEFDGIYNKEIAKRSIKYELKRLSKRKIRKWDIGAGRHFKLDVKNRFLMILLYYRLYITYTLVGFLFDLDQNNICTKTYKRLYINIIRQYLPIMHKLYKITKRLITPQEVEHYFLRFLSCIYFTEQQIPKPAVVDTDRKKM